MRVGELARRTGVTLRALRYYEQARLVVPTRSPNGYRKYADVAVRQVQQIRELMSLGLSVEETRPFVECLGSGHDAGDECVSSLAAYRRAIDAIDERIARLGRYRDGLTKHLEAAAGRTMASAEELPYGRSFDTVVGCEDVASLVGARVPSLALPSTAGSLVDLARLGPGRTVLYVYPLTGKPGVDLPEGWDTIPGARGCTAEACDFRDHHDELRAAGVARVFGLSTQHCDYQRELVERLRLPFAMLADPGLRLQGPLGLPTFEVGALTLYQRLTLIIQRDIVEHVFHPITEPERHARQVLGWLSDDRSRT